MRKKSHLSLAGYIVDVVDADMIDHPLAFRFGSLEPDLVPTFITTKHRIDLTFHKLEKKINKVIDEYDKNKGMTMKEKHAHFQEVNMQSADEICTFIRKCHEEYLHAVKSVENDCRYILQICAQVVGAILHLLQQNSMPLGCYM